MKHHGKHSRDSNLNNNKKMQVKDWISEKFHGNEARIQFLKFDY